MVNVCIRKPMTLIIVIHAFNKDSLSIYYELFIIIIYYLFTH